MHRLIRLPILGALLLSLAVLLPGAALADPGSVIDFEGLAEGKIVTSLASGNGISGDPVAGSVAVAGSPNPAIIFDATCTPSCTGGDTDLQFPEQGRVLIIAENLVDANNDGLVDNPDDADIPGQFFTFDFSDFGSGTVAVESLVAMDTGDDGSPTGGRIELYRDGVLLATVTIPDLGDHQKATVPIGVSGVDLMKVILADSGAIDSIRIEAERQPPPEEPGAEGCTPGFWKNHASAWATTGYATGQSLESVFDVPNALGLDDASLLEALRFKGGPGVQGGARILLRAAVAALLNAAHPNVDYALTSSDIITRVNAALASNNRDTMLTLARRLDTLNNAGCPIDR